MLVCDSAPSGKAPSLALKRDKPLTVHRRFRLTKLPTTGKCVSEASVVNHQLLHCWKECIEVAFETMLQETRGNRHSKVVVFVTPPSRDESPDDIRVTVDELTDPNNRLPSRIDLPPRCDLSRKYSFRVEDGLMNIHVIQSTELSSGAKRWQTWHDPWRAQWGWCTTFVNIGAVTRPISRASLSRAG